MCKDFKKAMGSNIRKIRIKNKITQEFLSLVTGISRSHIAMVEAGKRDITIGNLFKISRALNVNMREIFSFDNIEKYIFNSDDLYT